MPSICNTCKQSKKVCCGYEDDSNFGPTHCVDCCPQKVEHELQRHLGFSATRNCECLDLIGHYSVVYVRSNSVVGKQSVIACDVCGRLHIRVKS